ncbi:MAG: ATP-binding protein [Candidatus Eremiobacteraeota bacterium]|nr:ATP-binding protein [Candidatus Eremiobacteraeota bacterium]
MWYSRIIEEAIEKSLPSPEALILYGPRRVGKTSLLRHFENTIKPLAPTAYFSLDDPGTRAIFNDFSLARLETLFHGMGFAAGSKNYLFLDEILYFERVELLLKLIVDNFPHVKILASSSSSLLLKKSLSESLAGRKLFLELLPLSLGELYHLSGKNFFQFPEQPLHFPVLASAAEEMIVYGSYPEIVLLQDQRERRAKLRDLVESALFKDIFMLEGIRHPRALSDLLTLLAHQAGSLVNVNEIASTLGISRRLVDEYITILEKFFVLFRLLPYSHNPRTEVGSRFKIYFWDQGIRNSIINRFDPIQNREDRGALLENLVIAGIARRNLYSGRPYQQFFWRSYTGYEVDCVLEGIEKKELFAIEVKFSGKGKITRAFDAYNPDRKLIAGFENCYRFCL